MPQLPPLFFNISPVIPAVHMQTECKTTKLDEYFTQINIIKSNWVTEMGGSLLSISEKPHAA